MVDSVLFVEVVKVLFEAAKVVAEVTTLTVDDVIVVAVLN